MIRARSHCSLIRDLLRACRLPSPTLSKSSIKQNALLIKFEFKTKHAPCIFVTSNILRDKETVPTRTLLLVLLASLSVQESGEEQKQSTKETTKTLVFMFCLNESREPFVVTPVLQREERRVCALCDNAVSIKEEECEERKR
jgi:hypothetical protein